MTDSQVFVDTNILVYAHDLSAGERHQTAARKIGELWTRDILPAISVQVLQELYVTLGRKGVDPAEAREIIADYSTWEVVNSDIELLMDAMAVSERWQTSFWDALILSAAKRSKSRTLWTEDLSHGQVYDGVVVENPLLS